MDVRISVDENILFSRDENNYRTLVMVSLMLVAGAVILIFLQENLFSAVAISLIPFSVFLLGEKKKTVIDASNKEIVITYTFYRSKKKRRIVRGFSELDFVSLYKFSDNRTAALGGEGVEGNKIVNYCESLITKEKEEIILNVYSPEQWGGGSRSLKEQALARSVQLNLSFQDMTKDEKGAPSGQMRNFGFLDEEKKNWQEKVEGVMAERKSQSSYKLL